MNASVENLFKEYFDQKPYDCRIVGIDVETTGLDNDSRLVEIAAVGFEFDGFELKPISFQSLIDPEVEVPEVVSNIHGLTNEKLKGAPKADEVFVKLTEFLQGATTLVAHNADFDRRMIVNNFARYDKRFPFENLFKCSLQLAKRSSLNISSYKLGEVANFFGYKNENAHRAYDDALCALFIWGKLNQI